MIPEFTGPHEVPLHFADAPKNAERHLAGSQLSQVDRKPFRLRVETIVHRFFTLQFRIFEFFRSFHLTDRDTNSQIRLEAVLTGELPTVSSSGQPVSIKAGEYHLTDHAPIEQLFKKDSACRYVITHYSAEILEQAGIAHRVTPTPTRSLSKQMFDQLHKLLHNPHEEEDLRNLHYDHAVRELMMLHLQNERNVLPGELASEDLKRIYAADSLLQQDLSVHYEVPELAQKVGTNSVRLNKGFKQEFNMGVYDRMVHHRMEYAKLLLTTTMRTMDDIGIAIGYSNRNHFITAFKRLFEMTPRQWRLKRD